MTGYSYMIGIKYGYWTVNSVNYKTENNRIRAYAVCTCICGKQIEKVLSTKRFYGKSFKTQKEVL